MKNNSALFGMLKKILKWFFILLGVVSLIQMIWVLWFFGVIKIPFITREKAPTKEQFSVTGFSPDSQKIYFEFSDVSGEVKIGWMDLSTRKVNFLVPKDTKNKFAAPSSSADGKRLAIVSKEASNNFETSQIGILNLENKFYRVITNSNTYKQFPAFSEDGKKIIYAQANWIRGGGKTKFSAWDIYETDVRTGSERRLTEFCFFAVSNPFYLRGGKKFVFSGEYPSCNYPSRASSGEYDLYAKKYRENTIFMRSIGKESPLEPLFENGVSSNAASLSQDGKIFFVSRTNEIDGITGSNYNYDIFVYENAVIKRLTNLKTLLSGLVVSPRGDVLSYNSDELRNHDTRHWMMNIRKGTHSPIDLSNSKTFQMTSVIREKK